MFITIHMAFLNDHFRLHSCILQKWELRNFFGVCPCKHTCHSQHHCRPATCCDHGSFSMAHLCNLCPCFILYFVQHHKFFCTAVDGIHHFIRHQRRSHGSISTCCIDKRPQAKFNKHISFWSRCCNSK